MEEIKLPSGKILKFTDACIEDSSKLLDAVLRAFKKSNLDNVKFKDLKDTENISIGSLRDLAVDMATLPEISDLVQLCMKKCLYDSYHFDQELMDNEKMSPSIKEDYLTIRTIVIYKNCEPYLKKTFSESNQAIQSIFAILKSK